MKDPSSASPSPNADSEDTQSQAEAQAQPAPLEILLVEDNQMDVFVIVEVLRECGIEYRLQIAYDGERARTMLGFSGGPGEPMHPDLILLDLNLPKLSGIDLLSELRASSRHRDIPVVVVTSSDSEQDREAVRALDATAYFRKPSDLSGFMELAEVIRQALHDAGGPGAASA